MKIIFVSAIIGTTIFAACKQSAKISSTESPYSKEHVGAQQPAATTKSGKSLFIDVHNLGVGKVTFADVMGAHQKDLATEGKYGVDFQKFWFDEKNGKVYCLSSAKDSNLIIQTHREAHGLLPTTIYEVTPGAESAVVDGKQFFLDVHNFGAGNVSADAVEEAHKKDLAVEKKYGVNFINYWVDEKAGTVFCLSEAPDSNAIIHTHKEAHGLLPDYVLKVSQGE